MTYPNGDVREGEWENNLKHGKGIMYYANGSILIQYWNQGEKIDN